jgi:hypothetical protein
VQDNPNEWTFRAIKSVPPEFFENILKIYFFQKFKNTSSKAAASEEQQLWNRVFQP